MDSAEEFAKQFAQDRPTEERTFEVGDRVTGKLCAADSFSREKPGGICGRMGGCRQDNAPQFAGKILDKNEDGNSFYGGPEWEIEITSCPESPVFVGTKQWVNRWRIDGLEHAD
ncbi:hypothetical protein SEA_KEELAN_80 [Gordonia phage Keelan]|nr:hypothetical protein SEA_KEELAN_80 [Gordonia phage Keelan]